MKMTAPAISDVSRLPSPAKTSATPLASAHAATTMTSTNAAGAGQARANTPAARSISPSSR